MTFTIRPARLLAFLLLTSIALVAIGVISLANWHLEGVRNDYTILFASFFDLSTDTSIPTWYSAAILFLAAVFAGLITVDAFKESRKYCYHWLGLALLFALFSVDEVARIHERFGDRLGSRLVDDNTGLFYYSWVAAGLVFVILFALAYLPFLLSLPRRTAGLLILSGLLFVGGALGVEMWNGSYSETHGAWNMAYALGTAVEEFMEMAGVSIFIYALAEHLCSMYGGVARIQLFVATTPTRQQTSVQSCSTHPKSRPSTVI